LRPTFRLGRAAAALGFLMVAGTVGYRTIEGAGWGDAAYMVIMTVSTVGFAEVFPLSDAGRVLTGLLITFGVGTAFYTATAAIELMLERVSDRGKRVRMNRDIDRLEQHHIVCGFGRVGRAAWTELKARGVPCVVVESKQGRAEIARSLGAAVVQQDATHNVALEAAGVERAVSLLACVESDNDNLVIVLSARSLNTELQIVARANENESEDKLILAGADRVVLPQIVGAKRMAAMALQPTVADVIDLTLRGHHLEFRVERIPVSADSPVAGASLRTAGVREKSGAMVIAIEARDGELSLNPDPDRPLAATSALVAVGNDAQLRNLRQLCEVVDTASR